MSVVKINVLTVKPEDRAELEARFAARKHSVDQEPGFEGFELLRPTGDNQDYFVITRFDTEENFQAWAAQRHPRSPQETVTQSARLLQFERVNFED